MTENLVDPANLPPAPDTDIDGLEQPDTVSAAFARLYDDGRRYARAEIDRQKLRAAIVGAGVRDAAIFIAVALMLSFAILVALLVGLILALEPALGIWGALGAVLSSALIVTVALLLLAKARIGRMKRTIGV